MHARCIATDRVSQNRVDETIQRLTVCAVLAGRTQFLSVTGINLSQDTRQGQVVFVELANRVIDIGFARDTDFQFDTTFEQRRNLGDLGNAGIVRYGQRQ